MYISILTHLRVHFLVLMATSHEKKCTVINHVFSLFLVNFVVMWICALFIDLTGQYSSLLFSPPAKDVKIFLGRSAANITKLSKKMMTTMGEWELLDITSHKYLLGTVGGQHVDELAFHVG